MCFCIGLHSFAMNESNTLMSNSGPALIFPEKAASLKSSDDRLKIRLELRTTTNFNREILLTVDNRSTKGYDKGFDAKVSDDHPNDMYWVLEDIGLVIQAIDELSIDSEMPIGFRSDGNCTMIVKVSSLENPFTNMEVYLRNNETMDTYDILNGEIEITFEEGNFNDSYSIVFKPKVEIPDAVDLEDPITELAVFVSQSNQTLNIRKPDEVDVSQVIMFNILGQQIKSWSTIVSNKTDLPMEFKTGIYYVNMETNQGQIQRKILIK